MSIQRSHLPRKKRQLRGFALIFVLAFAAIIVVFSAVAGSQASFNLKLASNRGQTDRAYYAATTGTHLILSMLREPPPDDPDGDGVLEPWLSHDASLEWPMSNNTDMFAKVFHNLEGFDHATSEAPDLTKIPPGCFYIVSLGIVNGRFESGEIIGGVRYEQTTMGTTLRPSYPLLPHAAYAYDRLTIEDAIVDHFDSRNGTAPWQSSHYSTLGTTKSRPEASVASELTELGSPNAIQVTGTNARIYGNVLMGYGTSNTDLAALSSSLPGNPPLATDTPDTHARPYGTPGSGPGGVETRAVVGSVDTLTSTKKPPDMNYPPEKLAPGPVLSTLDEGKIYRHAGDLTVSGTIEVADTNGDGKIEDTIVLVERNITFRYTARINRHNPPRQLKFYSLDTAGTGTTFTVENNSKENYCLVAGANLDVTMESGSELWGAVFGKKVSLKPTSQLHYDVVLRDPTILADTYDYQLSSSVVSPGASVSPGDLRASGAAPGGGGTSGGGTSGTVGGTGGGATGGGCGCGCGGGSMLMMQKEMAMN